MSSTSQFYVIGAGLVGVVGALSVILFEHFKQEKRSRRMAQNLMRMDAQISVMRAELEQIRMSQRIKKREQSRSRKAVQSSLHARPQSDELRTASDVDTSDLEYFDLTDDDDDFADVVSKEPIQMILADVDRRLQTGDVDMIKETQVVLDGLCNKYPDNPELWYRLARCCHRCAVRAVTPQAKRENISKGASACWNALERDESNADFHKLYAILIGLRCDFEPTKQRISDGNLFKQHIDIAIQLNPNDASLHHMLGRFKYEVAGLKWFERKVATALFGEPPSGTYEEALACFLEAERLSTTDWKENKMYVGKCYIAMGQVRKGVEWLKQARNVSAGTQLEEHSFNTEIDNLLSKYKTYS